MCSAYQYFPGMCCLLWWTPCHQKDPAGRRSPHRTLSGCLCLSSASSYTQDFSGTRGNQFHFLQSAPSFLKHLQSKQIPEQYKQEKKILVLLFVPSFFLLVSGFSNQLRTIWERRLIIFGFIHVFYFESKANFNSATCWFKLNCCELKMSSAGLGLYFTMAHFVLLCLFISLC